MSEKQDKLIKGKGRKEYLSTTLVEDTLGRPIDPSDFLNWDSVLELERTGSEVRVAERKEETISEKIVRRALNRLPRVEREILVQYYLEGKTNDDIARILKTDEYTVQNYRIRAIGMFQKLLVEEKLETGLTSDYNQCSICSHPDPLAVDMAIHLWLDSHEWKIRGLSSELAKKFSLMDLSAKDIENHIQYHMGIETDRSILSKITGSESLKTVQLNVAIPPNLNTELERMVEEYSVLKPVLVRMSLQYGLRILSHFLSFNEEMFVEQLKLTKLIRRIRV